jgi:hypothetical protein
MGIDGSSRKECWPVAPAAQARGVVSRERCPTARTATAAADRATSLWTGSAHLILAEVGPDLASDQHTWVAGLPACGVPGRSGLPPGDIPGRTCGMPNWIYSATSWRSGSQTPERQPTNPANFEETGYAGVNAMDLMMVGSLAVGSGLVWPRVMAMMVEAAGAS